MEVLFFRAAFCIADDALDLLFHALHGVWTAVGALLRDAETDASTGAKLEDAFIVGAEPHFGADDGTVDLRVKVVCVWILRDELGDLDASDKVFVGLSH